MRLIYIIWPVRFRLFSLFLFSDPCSITAYMALLQFRQAFDATIPQKRFFFHQKLIAASMKLWFHLFILALIFFFGRVLLFFFVVVCLFLFLSGNTKIRRPELCAGWPERTGQKMATTKKRKTNERRYTSSVIRNVRREKPPTCWNMLTQSMCSGSSFALAVFRSLFCALRRIGSDRNTLYVWHEIFSI